MVEAMDQTGRLYHTPRAWVRFGGIFVAATIASGLIYMAARYRMTGEVSHAPLVVLVTLNAIVVYCSAWLIAPRLGQTLDHLPHPAEASTQVWLERIIFGRGTLLMSCAWGAMIACGLFALKPLGPDQQDWLVAYRAVFGAAEHLQAMTMTASQTPAAPPDALPDFVANLFPDPLLAKLLALFVFSGNLIIGAAIAFIGRFWWTVLKRLDDIDLRILNLSREPLPALLRTNSLVVTITALVSSLSILALILAGFAFELTAMVFSLSSMMLVVATYAVPILPLSNRLREVKSAELNAVEQRIEAILRTRSGLPQRADGPLTGPNGEVLPPETLGELSDLLETRKIIHDIQTLPPGGQVSVSAAGIVTFLSFLPTLIDFILKNQGG